MTPTFAQGDVRDRTVALTACSRGAVARSKSAGDVESGTVTNHPEEAVVKPSPRQDRLAALGQGELEQAAGQESKRRELRWRHRRNRRRSHAAC